MTLFAGTWCRLRVFSDFAKFLASPLMLRSGSSKTRPGDTPLLICKIYGLSLLMLHSGLSETRPGDTHFSLLLFSCLSIVLLFFHLHADKMYIPFTKRAFSFASALMVMSISYFLAFTEGFK